MKLFLFFFVFIIFSGIAAAQSIGIAPSTLTLSLGSPRQLVIFNPSDEEVSYSLITDRQEIQIQDATGILAQKTRKKIMLSLDENAEPFESYLEVKFQTPQQDGISILPGAKAKIMYGQEAPEIALNEVDREASSLQNGEYGEPNAIIGTVLVMIIVSVGVLLFTKLARV